MSTNNKRLVNIDNRTWTPEDVHYWINPEDGTVNAVIMFDGKKTRLRAGILILNNKDEILMTHEGGDANGELSLPGGGLEIDETPKAAGEREAQEEVHMDTKNLIDTGFDYCEVCDEVQPWVKKHVPEEEWWYNYYTCLILGRYDGEYDGEVAKVDEDPHVLNSARWRKLEDVVHNPTFKEQWKKAILKYVPELRDQLREAITESLDKTNTTNIYYHGSPSSNITKFRVNPDYPESFFTKSISYAAAFSLDRATGEPGYVYAVQLNYSSAIDIADEAGQQFIKENHIKNNVMATEALYAYLMKHDKILYGKQYDCIISREDLPQKALVTYGEAANICYIPLNSDQIEIIDVIDSQQFLRENLTIIKQKLTEDTRNQLVAKSRTAGPYKNQERGKNRFERKKFSKIATQVKSYNQIDMDQFFKQDILEMTIPVTGETDNYDVVIKINGVLEEIRRNIKANKNTFEYRTVLQALTKMFNTSNIYVKCSCDDFRYNFDHWSIVNQYSANDSASDPGPGKGIANPNDDKGIGCKHILLALANAGWIMHVASVINNYIHYAENNMQKAFLALIFPKLYDIPASAAVEQGLVPEDTKIETTKDIIDVINKYGKDRGKIKPGTNTNPVTGTGPNTKFPEKEKEEPKKEEKPAEKKPTEQKPEEKKPSAKPTEKDQEKPTDDTVEKAS